MNESSKSEVYVRSKIESPSGKDFGWDNGVRPLVALERPLAKVKYTDTGEVKFTSGDIEIEYSFEPVNTETTSLAIMEALEHDDYPPFWRNLIGLTIKNVVNGVTVGVNNLLPPDFHILFRPRTGQHYSSTASQERKAVFIQGGLERPSYLIILLHEIGHIVNERSNPELAFDEEMAEAYDAINTYFQPVGTGMLAKILQNERNAWAFTLKTLGPILAGQNEQAIFNRTRILDFIHNCELKSHSDSIRGKLALRK